MLLFTPLKVSFITASDWPYYLYTTKQGAMLIGHSVIFRDSTVNYFHHQLICWLINWVLRAQGISFCMIQNGEKKQILTSDKLESTNIISFLLFLTMLISFCFKQQNTHTVCTPLGYPHTQLYYNIFIVACLHNAIAAGWATVTVSNYNINLLILTFTTI